MKKSTTKTKTPTVKKTKPNHHKRTHFPKKPQTPFRPIDLTKDITFQYFFKKHPSSLISLLQTFLPLPKGQKIKKIQVLDPGLLPEREHHKYSFMDLKLLLNTGESVNVEMQNFTEPHFLKRTLFYLSRLYSERLKKAQAYESLHTAYSLIFTKFDLFKESEEYYSSFSMRRDKSPHFPFDKSLRIVTVELSKFKKERQSDLLDLMERWCYVLKRSGVMSEGEVHALKAGGGKDMKEAMGHFMKLTQSERERLWEEQRQKSEWIWQGRLEHARSQGLKQGLTEGVQEGHKQGRKEGLTEGVRQGHEKGVTEGMQQGLKEGQLKVALKMLKKQMPLSAISEFVGLSEEELKQLKNN